MILDDIYDSGFTMNKLLEYLGKKSPASMKVGVLMHKLNPKNKQYDFAAEYVGFVLPTMSFVVGYGLDYNDKFRDLAHVCVLNKKGIDTFKL